MNAMWSLSGLIQGLVGGVVTLVILALRAAIEGRSGVTFADLWTALAVGAAVGIVPLVIVRLMVWRMGRAFRADVVVVEPLRLVLGVGQHLARPIGELAEAFHATRVRWRAFTKLVSHRSICERRRRRPRAHGTGTEGSSHPPGDESCEHQRENSNGDAYRQRGPEVGKRHSGSAFDRGTKSEDHESDHAADKALDETG
jgi:hypothetical protein